MDRSTLKKIVRQATEMAQKEATQLGMMDKPLDVTVVASIAAALISAAIQDEEVRAALLDDSK